MSEITLTTGGIGAGLGVALRHKCQKQQQPDQKTLPVHKILELHGDAGESFLECVCSIYSRLDSSIGLNTGAGDVVVALQHRKGNNSNNIVTGSFFRSVKYWNCMEMLGNLL